MAKRQQIEQGLKDIGACWAVRSDKFCDANDPYGDQIDGRKTYHIHPDRSEPRQNSVKRFDSLDEIWFWIQACKRSDALHQQDGEYHEITWTEDGYDVVS